ncbi:hypothetical protein [Rhodoligotrophos defluvii]|uniref:hypothetical protein n=1 Tax=Rhodoligotrophos defluvii TaxID=2561934 RepID=UPI0019616AFA|nr:hypothetical protein [Rhodoligotrophos defluvii]
MKTMLGIEMSAESQKMASDAAAGQNASRGHPAIDCRLHYAEKAETAYSPINLWIKKHLNNGTIADRCDQFTADAQRDPSSGHPAIECQLHYYKISLPAYSPIATPTERAVSAMIEEGIIASQCNKLPPGAYFNPQKGHSAIECELHYRKQLFAEDSRSKEAIQKMLDDGTIATRCGEYAHRDAATSVENHPEAATNGPAADLAAVA